MADRRNSSQDNGDSHAPGEVLANLPRRRPQRVSARREAARGAGSRAAREKPEAAPASPPRGARQAAKRNSSKARATRTASDQKAATAPRSRTAASAGGERTRGRPQKAPVQGFEPITGRSVDPPTGAEVLGAAVDAAGDLAHAGLSLGGRLMRGALSRIPRP